MDNKHKILLVEDDVNLGTILKDFLTVKKFDLTLVQNGEEAAEILKNSKFDLCIFDVMLPKKDGFTLTKEIRKENDTIPIILLTAKSMQEDKIEGLKLGADDYITKPFSSEELLLRIKLILKRVNNSPDNSNNNRKFEIGKFHFDYQRRILSGFNKEQKLTSKEADLLMLLCVNKNEILERGSALKTIWHEDNYFTSRSMDVYTNKLRNYLKKDSSVEIITVHGYGIKLVC
ncbi:MAG: response regulator transcription factor [Melioribacteraceae bacterium]|nr:response regulator transcription factor [Melioribacteraceae bacterium]